MNLAGYSKEDVWNANETSLFMSRCTNKSLVLIGDEGHENRMIKTRYTISHAID